MAKKTVQNDGGAAASAGKAQKPGAHDVLLVRPAIKELGLDYLHVTLIVLVAVLVLFSYSLSTMRQATVLNCTLNATGSCVVTNHTASYMIGKAASVIAGYGTANTSLSILPYYSLVNQSRASFLENSGAWFVSVPYIDPLAGNAIYRMGFVINDSTGTLIRSYGQSVNPPSYGPDMATSFGAIDLSQRTACASSAPYPVYAMIDPYAPGAVQAINTSIAVQEKYSNSINTTYKLLITNYTRAKYAAYGQARTLWTLESLFCASKQPRFPAYMKNYSLIFNYNPLENYTLASVADGSGLNMTEYNSCMSGALSAVNAQASLGIFYNVSTTPSFIANCKYATIPQRLGAVVAHLVANTSSG